jgi:hypothetical protein
MMDKTTSRELAQRGTADLDVRLFWDTVTDELAVVVTETATGVSVELATAPHEALDVFYHPYAHMGVPRAETTADVDYPIEAWN